MPDLLEFKNLRIEATSYPPGEPPRDVVLVDGVSVSVAKGKVLGLIGESGAGKSTIGLSAMAYGRGGVRLTGGEILLNGRNIRGLDASGLRALRGREVTYVNIVTEWAPVAEWPGAAPLALSMPLTGDAPAWNFHKFLVSRDGRQVQGFPARMDPDSPALKRALEQALATVAPAS